LKYCGWVICEHQSNYENDFPTSSGYCLRKEGLCDAGKNPISVFENIKEDESK